jgi:hypothetical protein
MGDSIRTFAEAVKGAEPRPESDAGRDVKKNYSERLSRHFSTVIASGLRSAFSGIKPDPDGGQQESPARGAKGLKKLDVNYSKPEIGLGLGISVKTINSRDPKTKNYKKNYTRIDAELRAEAKDYHERQPYAVLIAVIFLPADACDDLIRQRLRLTGPPRSSFAGAIQDFRRRAGRKNPRDEQELFERVFIATYEHEGARAGEVWFLDVTDKPPRKGRPPSPPAIDFAGFVKEVTATYDERNHPKFEFADDEGADVDGELDD